MDRSQTLCTSAVVSEETYDPDGDRSPTVAIADALAHATGDDATDLQPLYSVVDSDALDRLFAPGESGAMDVVVKVAIDQWLVFVRGDGAIRVCDTTQQTTPTPVFAGDVASTAVASDDY